jgi:hypothetical protein
VTHAAESLKSELADALAGLSATEMDARPAGRDDAWSIRQIAEHLRLSYDLTAHAFRQQIARGSTTRAIASMKQLWAQFYILRLGGFPRGVKAHPLITPTRTVSEEDGAATLARLSSSLDVMQDYLRKGEREFGDKRAVRHFVLGPMTMRQWMRFHERHTRHHVRQIAEIRRQVNV